MASFCKMLSSVCRNAWSTVIASPLKQVCGSGNQGLLGVVSNPQLCQTRHRYTDKHMRKDHLRRMMVAEYAVDRLRVNSLRRNTILPLEIREIADKEIAEFPRNSCRTRLVNRCVITSRPRGKLRRWRMSRIVWRHLADYNKLSGVTRAWW